LAAYLGRVADESCHVMPMRSAGDGEGERREAVAPCNRRGAEHDGFGPRAVVMSPRSMIHPAGQPRSASRVATVALASSSSPERNTVGGVARLCGSTMTGNSTLLSVLATWVRGRSAGAAQLGCYWGSTGPGIPSAPRSVALATSTTVLPSNSLRRASNRSSEVSPVPLSTASSRPSPPATGSFRRSRSSRSS
jgi:hypothetical protein